MQLSFIHFFYFLYTFSFYIFFSGVDKKNQIPCMHPLIPSQNLFVSLLADTRISLTIISFGKSITIMINIRRIMCLWLIKNVEQGKKFPVPTRNRTSDLHILLQCFSTETQRLNGELGLLCDLITTHHQAQSFFSFLHFSYSLYYCNWFPKIFLYGNGIFTMLVSGEGLVTPPPPSPSPAMNNECSLISTPQTARISVHWE